MSGCLDCDSPYHLRCVASPLARTLARRPQPDAVLAAYRVLAHHVATTPPTMDATATVRLAAHVLRGTR